MLAIDSLGPKKKPDAAAKARMTVSLDEPSHRLRLEFQLQNKGGSHCISLALDCASMPALRSAIYEGDAAVSSLLQPTFEGGELAVRSCRRDGTLFTATSTGAAPTTISVLATAEKHEELKEFLNAAIRVTGVGFSSRDLKPLAFGL